jgi:E3 ubiquitin-protein ligase DOA10
MMSSGVQHRARGSGSALSGWTVGFALFAAMMMMMTGVWGAIVGFAAILENDFYTVRGDYVFKFDVTTWGWIHLVVGVVVAVAGAFVFTGRTWARVVGIAAATVSAVVSFMFIPYYPIWSLLVIALDVAAIWALALYSRQAAEDNWYN